MTQFFELLTGDYLFDPHPGTRYNKDDDHIAQIIELLGPFPRSIALSGKFSAEIFTRKGPSSRLVRSLSSAAWDLTLTFGRTHAGELKHIHKLKFWPMHSVLQDKYLITEAEAKLLESFLQPMLNLNPDKRATARDMLDHEWLQGVVVQGEIEAHLLESGEGHDDRQKRVEEGKQIARGIRGMNTESPAVMNGASSRVRTSRPSACSPADELSRTPHSRDRRPAARARAATHRREPQRAPHGPTASPFDVVAPPAEPALSVPYSLSLLPPRSALAASPHITPASA